MQAHQPQDSDRQSVLALGEKPMPQRIPGKTKMVVEIHAYDLEVGPGSGPSQTILTTL
jgi:hypothetical protein